VPVAKVPTPVPKPAAAATAPAEPPGEKPAERYVPAPAGFTCTGIMRLPGGAIANINGRFVAAGETVGDARVVDIKDFAVVMELDGECFELPVGAGAGASPKPTSEQGPDNEENSDEQPPAQQ